MGHGVMEPEYRGATARRLMREAQENAALYAKDTERVMAQRDEARKERDTLKAQLAEKSRALELAQTTLAENAEDMTEDDIALGCLSDILNEQTAALVAAHNAAMEGLRAAEEARAKDTAEETIRNAEEERDAAPADPSIPAGWTEEE